MPEAKKIRTGKALDFSGLQDLAPKMKAFQPSFLSNSPEQDLGTLNSPNLRF